MRFLTSKSMLLIIVSVLFVGFSFIPFVYGPGTYHIEKQWIKIWINKDGTIDLLYNLTFVCDTGTFTWITIGQPNKDFTIWSCFDQYDRNLTTSKIVDDWTGVKINFQDEIQTGQKITILLLTNVDRMIWEDEMNPGNVGMLFTACWWEVSVVNLRIAVVLPENVKEDEIISGDIKWSSAYLENGNWVVYWEQSDLYPNEQFQIGVGFPKEYVDKWYVKGPYADFTWSPSSPHINETITFDASESTPNGGVIVSYMWDFGDGDITTVVDPIVYHTYVSKGNYNVILNVTDSRGLWSAKSEMISILPPRGLWDWLGGTLPWVLPVVALSIIAVAAVVVFRNIRRLPYSKPGFSMEALGVRKGLTAVEAATLLDVNPRRILTMILFGLMRKGAVKVVETKPKLRLQVLSTAGLRYYEDWFIDAIVFQSRVGTLSDKRLSSLILKLLREVDKKVKYYCRADTVKYYKKTVEKAWGQVRKAGTPEVKAEVFNEELEWLMMAPRYKSRVKRVFSRGEEIPVQSSWWLPYWTTHYAPSRFRGVEGKPTAVQSLPAVRFANAAVTTIESTVGRIVTNVEAFSKSLIPVTPSAEARASSSERAPVSRGGCVCACASCACACACASCACACASGGAG